MGRRSDVTWRLRSRALLLACLLAASCNDPRPGGGPSGPSPTPGPTPTSGPTDPCDGVLAVPGLDLRLETVATGLDRPVHASAAPGDLDRLFVVEQAGRIRIVELATGAVLEPPFLDLVDRVSCCGERGLFSIAFHPGYAGNGRFFVNYTDRGGDVRISELAAAARDRADSAGERVLLTIEHSRFANHNGGELAFGPDGLLHAGVGDGGGAGDPLRAARGTGSLLGKVLRLDVDSGALVAASNPFGNEVFHIGLRNPWRMSFDRATGDLYLGDVGQDSWEEIDFVAAGSSGGVDFGWSAMEGLGHCFNDPGCNGRGIRLPLLEYPTSAGCAVTGGHVYRGCALPDLRGTYFYGDFCAGFVRSFRVAGGAASDLRDWTGALGAVSQLSSFGVDGRGEIYLMSLSGSVEKLVPR